MDRTCILIVEHCETTYYYCRDMGLAPERGVSRPPPSCSCISMATLKSKRSILTGPSLMAISRLWSPALRFTPSLVPPERSLFETSVSQTYLLLGNPLFGFHTSDNTDGHPLSHRTTRSESEKHSRSMCQFEPTTLFRAYSYPWYCHLYLLGFVIPT